MWFASPLTDPRTNWCCASMNECLKSQAGVKCAGYALDMHDTILLDSRMMKLHHSFNLQNSCSFFKQCIGFCFPFRIFFISIFFHMHCFVGGGFAPFFAQSFWPLRLRLPTVLFWNQEDNASIKLARCFEVCTLEHATHIQAPLSPRSTSQV